MPDNYSMQLSSIPLQTQEKQAIFSLAGISALRMLGLFMLMPILSLYSQHLIASTPLLIGIALGCYGLTQALLQIPFGMYSDRFGRKPIIALGIILFVVGSVIAAQSHQIWGLILGRSLQGAGAVGSATNALLADLTRTEQRTKAMAVIGITIGGSFLIAMLLGPLLINWFSVPTIFWICFLFGLFALLILFCYVPKPTSSIALNNKLIDFKKILLNKPLFKLNLGIFLLHTILTANFFVLPFIFNHFAGIVQKNHWQIYLPVLTASLMTVVATFRYTQKPKQLKIMFSTSIVLLLVAELLLSFFYTNVISIAIELWVFFTAFTLLEAMIPSLVSKIAPIEQRGAAMGINSSYQFMGIFIGGSLSGWLFGHFSMNLILIGGALLAGIWLLVDSIHTRE